MKITVLDGYTLSPGDLSWKELEKLGDCTIYDRTPSDLTVKRAKNADIVLTNKTVLSDRIINELPKMKYIGILATGYDVVDINTAKEKGIPVTNVPSYGTESVAQMVFAHILNLIHRVAHHALTVREGKWAASDDFCYWDFPLMELQGKILGIIGIGRIGQATSRIAKAFGMKILAYDIYPPEKLLKGVKTVALDDLLKKSDIVTLHSPMTGENKKMINKQRLEMMKSTAYLINTSRGPLIDEQALADTLNKEEIAGAGLDVLSIEPPKKDNPLYNAKNCFITPHIAWATKAARQRLMNIAVDNVMQYINGKPVNIVNEV
ncbi:MAG: D-2-hydroxyacid dehydrogenase [Bacteroidales bacterium]|nr:D-2-hydroxyacid dehydrogenase [Bacteroidales bacterium]